MILSRSVRDAGGRALMEAVLVPAQCLQGAVRSNATLAVRSRERWAPSA